MHMDLYLEGGLKHLLKCEMGYIQRCGLQLNIKRKCFCGLNPKCGLEAATGTGPGLHLVYDVISTILYMMQSPF